MKFATWNINSLGVRLPQVLAWLQDNPVDVLALQELKLTDDRFPLAEFSAAGYQSSCFGQKTYNGVALLSRAEQSDVVRNIPAFDDDMARVLTATVQGIRVIGAYFPNGQAPGTDKFEYKMGWLKGLRNWVREELTQCPRLMLMGDFNVTFDDTDVWDPVGMRDQIHCTEEERYHLRALQALGLHDSFRLFEQAPKSYTWWDYREQGFRRNRGLRIDHILISAALKPLATACNIDKKPRKNERPSDHAPVVLEMNIPVESLQP
jgi:exodeoxyribonuclease-3